MYLNPVLSLINHHERDNNILFFEKNHKYQIITDINNKYTSVTTYNHSHFPVFDADAIITKMMKGKGWKEGHKYWGLTKEEIKLKWSSNNSAELGTKLHYKIECFMNEKILIKNYTHKDLYDQYQYSNCFQGNLQINEQEQKQEEWQYFIEFIKDTPKMKPYRTEWLIYHEDLKIAGSIDMVYENEDGTLSIYDWKRSKDITRINLYNKYALTECINHLPDSNFWHYALQLNMYKMILEDKYNKKVKDLYLVRLYPNQPLNQPLKKVEPNQSLLETTNQSLLETTNQSFLETNIDLNLEKKETYELIKIPELKQEIIDLKSNRINSLKIL